MVLHSRNCGILSTGLAVSSRRNDGIKQAGILNSHGGHSIGVFNPETQDKSKVYTMMEQNRIKYFTEAIYSKDSDLEKLLKNIIDKTVVTEILEKRHFECNVEAGEHTIPFP